MNLKQETYSRRNNIIIEGVQEREQEDCVYIVSDICASVLNLPDINRYIDKAHRNGPKRPSGNRPIRVRFLYHQDAEMVLSRGNMARAAGLRVIPDYPKEIQREHFLLEKVQRISAKDGRMTKLRGNKLYYNGKGYSVKDIHTAGLDIGRIAERRNDQKVKFYGRFSKFSNFFPVELLYKGKRFTSSEQLYQYRRAENTKDESLAWEILLANDPVDCKTLAKRIPENRSKDLELMREVIELKFAKDPFKCELKKTGTAALIECNPYDTFWSAGCHLDNREPDGIKGQNQLGKLLENQRERILQQQ